MKKTLKALSVCALFIICAITTTFADPYGLDQNPQGVKDFFFGLSYHQVTGTLNLQQSTTFFGFVTDISIKVEGSSATYTTNQSSGSTTLFNGDSYSGNFWKPVSSPTILTVDLPQEGTVQYTIGGLKQK